MATVNGEVEHVLGHPAMAGTVGAGQLHRLVVCSKLEVDLLLARPRAGMTTSKILHRGA